jgi:Uma2 family endonuclease
MSERLTERLYSLEEFWALAHTESEDGPRSYELDEGIVVEMSPTGGLHGFLSSLIARLVGNFIDEHDLGLSFGAETGFILHQTPEGQAIVRAPDFAFVSKARAVPMGGKFDPIAPDFAVEIVSPSDTLHVLNGKLRDYFAYGAAQVWLVYPLARAVEVYTALDSVQVLTGEAILHGGALLPDFTMALNDLFACLD